MKALRTANIRIREADMSEDAEGTATKAEGKPSLGFAAPPKNAGCYRFHTFTLDSRLCPRWRPRGVHGSRQSRHSWRVRSGVQGLDTLEEAGGGGDPKSPPVSSKGLMARTSRLSCRRSYVLNSTVNNSTR